MDQISFLKMEVAAGVGAAAASVAVGVTWVLKDGIGCLGSLVAAGLFLPFDFEFHFLSLFSFLFSFFLSFFFLFHRFVFFSFILFVFILNLDIKSINQREDWREDGCGSEKI